MMKSTELPAKLAPALLAAQKAIGKALKSSANPFFKSKYANLETVIDAVKGPMNDNDVVITQLVQRDELGIYVETVLMHTSGECVVSKTPVIVAKPNNPQAMVSGVTYAKRCGLEAISVLPTEDDDGNKATEPPKKPAKHAEKPTKPAKAVDSDEVAGAREELSMLIDEHKISEAKQEAWIKHFKVKNLGQLKLEEVKALVAGITKDNAKESK
jgi:hypothetical protein